MDADAKNMCVAYYLAKISSGVAFNATLKNAARRQSIGTNARRPSGRDACTVVAAVDERRAVCTALCAHREVAVGCRVVRDVL
ncbi:hypothetical protein [Burkholderia territorii]|uniref:hypothetical protein n=1 Tax=Burkholderia territorii TaxID=1503055 RepID=UPI00075B61EF|nr:hypothetical protein [Burkholderia territorii]